MNQLQEFNFNGNEVRTVMVENEPWFVLKDVCDVLDIRNATDVSKRLDEDEVTRFNLGGLSGQVNVINESGLYSVILRSDKPQAKPFQKWVTSEVLPTLRKTGVYSMSNPSNPMDVLKLMFQAQEQHEKKVFEIDNRVIDLEENVPLSPSDYNSIGKKIGERVRKIMSDRKIDDNKEIKSILYKSINGEIKVIAKVGNRSRIKAKDYDKVYNFIDKWEPSHSIDVLINEIADCDY